MDNSASHDRLMQARHAVLDAWRAADYADQLGVALRSVRWIDVLDDAIRAVWSATNSRTEDTGEAADR